MSDKTQTEIKRLMTSHLTRGLFGLEVYGQHEIPMGDLVCVIEVRGPSRFERYGSFVAFHPIFGKWQATLLSARHTGKPVQVLTADQIRENLKTAASKDFIYKVYGVEKPEYKPVIWDIAEEVL